MIKISKLILLRYFVIAILALLILNSIVHSFLRSPDGIEWIANKRYNDKRRSDLIVLAEAIKSYRYDNNAFPSGITNTLMVISKDGADICAFLVNKYLRALPTDPISGFYTDCSTYDTGYFVFNPTNTDKVILLAPAAIFARNSQIIQFPVKE